MNDDSFACKLLNAIADNDTAAASSLISTGNVEFDRIPMPFFYAAERGRVEIMELLLDAGANINAVNEFQETSCHAAIRYGHLNALKLLLERGADVSHTGNLSLLKAAKKYGDDQETAVLLINCGASLDDLTAEVVMSLCSSVEVLKSLLARNVDLSRLRDSNGATLCHHVVADDLLRAAINIARVNVNVADNFGKTPLHVAATRCHASKIEILVEFGADVNARTRERKTALHLVCGDLQTVARGSCVELLLALGADVSATDINGRTACHGATHFLLAMSACLAAGADFDQLDTMGNTPRNLAMRAGHGVPSAALITPRANESHERVSISCVVVLVRSALDCNRSI